MSNLLFAYGTLRDQAHPFTSEAERVADGCWARGQMYHVLGGSTQQPIYPVVDFDEPGTVVGTLLIVDGAALSWIHAMELGAGYEAREVEVTVPGSSQTALAVAYHYPDSRRGAMVPHGDWRVEQAS